MLKSAVSQIALVAVGVFTIGYGVTQFSGPSNKTTLNDVIAATVSIEGYCTGTVVEDPDLSDGRQFTVLTAKHCALEGGKPKPVGTEIEVRIPKIIDGEIVGSDNVKTKIVKIADSDDILLQSNTADPDKVKPVRIHQGTLSPTDLVLSVSNPYDFQLLISRGEMSFKTKQKAFGDVSKTTLFHSVVLPVGPGSSGSAIYKMTDDGYEVVGTLTGGLSVNWVSLPYAYYTPLSELQEFLSVKKESEE